MAQRSLKPTPLLRLSPLGLGFLWSWATSVWIDLPFGGGAALRSLGSPWFWMQLATGIAFLALAAAAANHRRLPMNKGAATLLCVAGSIVVALGARLPVPSPAVVIAGAGAMGVGSAWLQLLWADAFARQDATIVEVAIPSSGFATIICMAIDSLITGPVRFAASLAFVAVSGVLLGRMESLGEEPSALEGQLASTLQSPDGRRGIAAPMAVCLLTGLLFSIASITAFPASVAVPLVDDAPVLIGGLFSIALCLFVFHHSVRIDMVSTFRWMTPLLGIGALCLMAAGDTLSLLGRTLVAVSEMALVICVYVGFIETARSRRGSAAALVGLVLGGYQLGLAAGPALFEAMAVAGLTSAESVGVALALFLLGTILIPARRPRRADDAASDGAGEARNPLDEASSLLARVHSLTQREEEILALLAKGRSQPYIRDALFLSSNTIATYVKSIYKKLDVHSKQELIDLVSKTAESPR